MTVSTGERRPRAGVRSVGDAAQDPRFPLPFMFVAPVFYNVLIVINKQKHLILVGVLSIALNVGLNLILIPRYSYNGAASATIVRRRSSWSGSTSSREDTTNFGSSGRFSSVCSVRPLPRRAWWHC